MSPFAQFIVGGALSRLRELPDESVQCMVTSPPYYGLRVYGGGEEEIGQEAAIDDFVRRLVEVFREARRVLRSDGTLWLNLGDSHETKRLVGMPWRVALALQADGWYLRADVIWEKPALMPSSVKDRPTISHEYVFLLTKSPRYFYDAAAVAEPSTYTDKRAGKGRIKYDGKREGKEAEQGQRSFAVVTETRNRRSVWRIAVSNYKGAHFALMPAELASICIQAGTKPGDVVLDPFGGGGTTALAALRLGRSSIYIDLNPAYRDLAIERLDAEGVLP